MMVCIRYIKFKFFVSQYFKQSAILICEKEISEKEFENPTRAFWWASRIWFRVSDPVHSWQISNIPVSLPHQFFDQSQIPNFPNSLCQFPLPILLTKSNDCSPTKTPQKAPRSIQKAMVDLRFRHRQATRQREIRPSVSRPRNQGKSAWSNSIESAEIS